MSIRKVIATQRIDAGDCIVVVDGLARPLFEGESKLATYTATGRASKGTLLTVDLVKRTITPAPRADSQE